MFSRNWLHNTALRGCVAAALIVVVSTGETRAQEDGNAKPQESQKHQVTPNEARPLSIAEQPKPSVIPQQQQPKPTVYKSSCGETENHDEADLCEQMRMASAAEDAVWWARFQTGIGIAGFVAVLLSLGFTGWAAWAAAQAANAARASVDIATDTAQRQLRAYLLAEKATIVTLAVGEKIKVNVTFNNHGQTPAHDVITNVLISVFKLPLGNQIGQLPEVSDHRSRGFLGCGKEALVTISTKREVYQAEFDAIHDGRCAIFIHGEVTYSDIYRRIWKTQFRFEYSSEALERKFETFIVSAQGNEAY